MEENIKLAHTKNTGNFNFNATISIPIDANVNIKTILDVHSYLFDQKVECGNGKAIVSGKIGVKVLYLDLDNMTNTATETTSFNETYLDNSITAETYLNMSNSTISNDILSTDGNLKINCNVNINPVAYFNLPLASTIKLEDDFISKKSEFESCLISQFVNTRFEHTTNLETKSSINKLLCYNSYLTVEKTTPAKDYFVVEGKITTCLLYETIESEDKIIKELKETTNVKYDVEVSGLTEENVLDLSFNLDRSKNEISTEIDDNLNIITIKNSFQVCGVALKPIKFDVIDDLYSTDYDIETTSTKREYTKQTSRISVLETVVNEITLNNDELAIDEIIANLNHNAEITNTYIKDNTIFFEGVVTSNLTYIDENKEIKHKQLEAPFIINSKHEANVLDCVHAESTIIDCKIKVKRGTIIEVEYVIHTNLAVYEKASHEMIDNFTLGKQLDFSKYDYQIFIAKPGETQWELCKRIKIAPNKIYQHNKTLPLIMEGGEKVIIKR